MSEGDQGAPENVEVVYKVDQEKEIMYEAEIDTFAGTMLGIQSIVGTVWWILVMFIYIKNQSGDTLTTINNAETIPIVWLWERIGELNGSQVYIALSVMFSWFLYLIVSVVEMISWCMYMSSEFEFARFYFSTVGYWGSIIFYALPWVFALVQLILVNTQTFPGSWTLFHFMISAFMWIYTSLIHFFFIDDFVQFIDAQDGSTCYCDAPEVLPLSSVSSYEGEVAHKFATEERAKACAIQCPDAKVEQACPFDKIRGQSMGDYIEACESALAQLRLKDRQAAGAAPAEASEKVDEEFVVSETEKLEDGWM